MSSRDNLHICGTFLLLLLSNDVSQNDISLTIEYETWVHTLTTIASIGLYYVFAAYPATLLHLLYSTAIPTLPFKLKQ